MAPAFTEETFKGVWDDFNVAMIRYNDKTSARSFKSLLFFLVFATSSFFYLLNLFLAGKHLDYTV